MDLPPKGPRYRAAAQEQRILRAYGLPSRYWERFDTSHIASHLINLTADRPWLKGGQIQHISVRRQRELIGSLFETKQILESSRVLGIGAEPTDELAMGLAANLLRHTIAIKGRPLMIDMRYPPSSELSIMPDVAFLHNLPQDCHQMRAQLCRDWLHRLDDTFRVVIVAGANPIEFFQRRLFYPLDAALYLRGELNDQDVQH